MKQVTIEHVKKRIARIENGESVMRPSGMGLSMQHEFELACLRELVAVTEQLHAVVAENAAMKEFIVECAIAQGEGNWTSDAEKTVYVPATEWMPITPVTDAAIASLRAEGVEMLVARRMKAAEIARQRDDLLVADSIEDEAIRAQMFANELRSKSEVQS